MEGATHVAHDHGCRTLTGQCFMSRTISGSSIECCVLGIRAEGLLRGAGDSGFVIGCDSNSEITTLGLRPVFLAESGKGSRSGEITEQTEGRGKPSHDSWLELSILVLTEPSLFQSRGFNWPSYVSRNARRPSACSHGRLKQQINHGTRSRV